MLALMHYFFEPPQWFLFDLARKPLPSAIPRWILGFLLAENGERRVAEFVPRDFGDDRSFSLGKGRVYASAHVSVPQIFFDAERHLDTASESALRSS